ncbi:MAG: hypothetical protein LBQ57_00615, partial [Spirochaetales bacterium]|nr:hypothetical protein [Spirochaetales bacterium]
MSQNFALKDSEIERFLLPCKLLNFSGAPKLLSNSKFEKICPAIPKSIQIVSNLNAFTHKKRFQTAIPYL